MLQALPYAKRLELERRDDAARRASLAGIALALLGAARLRGRPVAIGEIAFVTEGKPTFARGPWFSIAHTGPFACCALSIDLDPGIDLEACRDQDDSATLEKRRRWTAVEAALKAAGQGIRHAHAVQLAADLSSAELDGARYLLRILALRPGLVCQLALRGPADVTIEQIDLALPIVSATLERSLRLRSQRE